MQQRVRAARSGKPRTRGWKIERKPKEKGTQGRKAEETMGERDNLSERIVEGCGSFGSRNGRVIGTRMPTIGLQV